MEERDSTTFLQEKRETNRNIARTRPSPRSSVRACQSVGTPELLFSLTLSLLALALAAISAMNLLEAGTGTARMVEVAKFIREGSEGFIRTQYLAIAGIAALTSALLFFTFLFRSIPK